ncbi:hypothetical protein [Desulfobaculum bizertense]|uniref:hypothetical protein n=1 Tax=Desulfobaculum bizertense TaxID=376490 RepID=UPI0009997028|nr:hypothetical protein [Desulfobaculum bizertense]
MKFILNHIVKRNGQSAHLLVRTCISQSEEKTRVRDEKHGNKGTLLKMNFSVKLEIKKSCLLLGRLAGCGGFCFCKSWGKLCEEWVLMVRAWTSFFVKKEKMEKERGASLCFS